ncbi:MAG: hypothetical protein PHI34_11320 [Acidobacteriota bacterium]|nr:hypothetical protein [Acidobacteriota bacterium]
MFRKELADVLKQTGWFLAVAIVLPVPLILLKWVPGPYLAVLVPVLGTGLVFWSLFLGASLLGRERGQQAVEYALSLPHSRLGLLARMAGPRLLVLSVLWLAAWAGMAAAGIPDPNHILPLLAVGVSVPWFLVSLSLSVFIDNFIVLCLASIVGWYAAWMLITRLILGFGVRPMDLNVQSMFVLARPDIPTYHGDFTLPLLLLQFILPIVPFVAALLLSFGRFDVRRSRRFNRRYGLAFAISLALCALTAFGGRVITDSLAQKYFHLTQSLKLIEWRYGSKSIRIRGPEASLKVRIDAIGLWSAWDDGTALFAWDYEGRLNRIDLATGKADSIYQLNRKHPSLRGQRTYGSTIVFIENGARPNEIRLVALDQSTNKTKRYVFAHEALRAGRPQLIGTDVRDGKRFWICLIIWKADVTTLRLWEDGRVEEILVKGRLQTANTPVFINGLLLFTGKEPIFVLRDDGQSFVMKKEFPAGEIFHAQEYFSYFRQSLDDPPPSFIYGRRGPKLARMSLATLEIEEIGDLPETDDTWGYVHRSGDRAYFVGGSRSRKNLDIYALSETGMRLIRSFPGIDTQRRDTRFNISDSGILITQGERVRVYAFPDLKKIDYN